MTARRILCGWCPTELPEDHADWYLHFLTVHNMNGYSVRHYPALDEEQEMAELVTNYSEVVDVDHDDE